MQLQDKPNTTKSRSTATELPPPSNHGESSIALASGTWLTLQQPNPFACPICCKVFTSSQALGGHQNAHRKTKYEARKKKAILQKRLAAEKHRHSSPTHNAAVYRPLYTYSSEVSNIVPYVDRAYRNIKKDNTGQYYYYYYHPCEIYYGMYATDPRMNYGGSPDHALIVVEPPSVADANNNNDDDGINNVDLTLKL